MQHNQYTTNHQSEHSDMSALDPPNVSSVVEFFPPSFPALPVDSLPPSLPAASEPEEKVFEQHIVKTIENGCHIY